MSREHIAEEKAEFIHDHEREISPLLSDQEKKQLLGDDFDLGIEGNSDILLERFETKVYRLDKPAEACDPEAKRFLVSFSDPVDYVTQLPIIERLMQDRRCSGISVVTDNIAGVAFSAFAEKHSEFVLERKNDIGEGSDPQSDLVFPDIARAAEGVDVAFVGIESVNSPSGSMVFNAKSVFGADKLFIVNGGWTGVGGRKELFANTGAMDQFDGIFVNDELAKQITESQLPEAFSEKVIATGTPSIDALDVANGPEFERKGREKLGIADDEIALLYCGDRSAEHKSDEKISTRINEETFEETLAAVKRTAQSAPDKHFVLMVRPHPRDDNKEELLRPQTGLPPNLRIVSAERGVLSMKEAGYAADTLLSIVSTENFMQPLRGKASVFLGYRENASGQSLGGRVIEKVYADDQKVIATHEGISFVDSQDALVATLADARRCPAKVLAPDAQTHPSSVDAILNIALS